MELIVGTYGRNLWLLNLDAATFDVRGTSLFEAENTSYLALSPDKRYLFAVSESGDRSGMYSFELHSGDRPLPRGRMVRRSEVRPVAPDPCHVLYVPGYFNSCGDPDNGVLLTADYSGGSISVYPVQEGRIAPASQIVRFEGSGPVPERQTASHIHHLVLHGNLLMAVDLGADCIHVLRLFDGAVRPLCDGRLERTPRLERLFDIPAPAGSGPRHLVLNAEATHAYVLTELSNEILVYAMPDFTAPDDRPTLLQQLAVGDASFPEQAGGDLQLSPDGRHLYASLRNGGDGLVIARVEADGMIRRIGYQRTGNHVRDFFFLQEDLLMIFCKNSRCIQVYRRNIVSGALRLVREIKIGDVFGEPVHGVIYSV
jgi:3-carboxymuconate cyclase